MSNSTGAPEPLLPSLCANLEALLHARGAEARLSVAKPSGAGTLVTLPSWVWLTPLINVGRKSRDDDGTLAVLPTRIDWEAGAVVTVKPGQVQNLRWRLVGLGHDRSGVSPLSVSASGATLGYPRPSGVSILDSSPYADSRELAEQLEELITLGTTARWNMILSLEPLVRASLVRANRAVAFEIGSYRNQNLPEVVDQLSLDDLATRLLFGEGGTSAISRMIDRSLTPNRFAKVDPLRYFVVGIRARAEEEVRRQIGDPKVGPKVRRVATLVGAANIDEVVARYRALYPRDFLATKRAIAALTAGPETTASAHDDAVIEFAVAS